MIWIVGIFVSLFTSLWMGTQKFAARVSYDPSLGDPFMIDKGIPYYYPWKIIGWYRDIHPQFPDLFNSVYPWIIGPVAGGLIFLIIVRSIINKKPTDNYGSARWAEREDLLAMDLISADGVVIGLYDTGFTKFVTKIVRKLEMIKKDKEIYAELAYKEKVEKRRSELFKKRGDCQNKGDMDGVAKINKELESIGKYNPKQGLDWIRVYFWIWLFKKVNKLYTNMPHFYLRDNSNKHMAVIAPTRSGKGVGLIIPTLLGGWTSSCIVNDIKSENWAVTAGWRKRMGQCCIKFEPTSADGSTARWNPLDEIEIGTPKEESQATNIAHVLADYEGKGKLDHWGSNAEMVIMTCILHLKYAHYADKKHYPQSPCFSSVANFLKANIVEEEVEDEETGEVSVETNPKGFVDTLNALMEFQHVPYGGIDIEYWDRDKQEMATRHFTADDLHNLYPTYTDIYEVDKHVHPLIYKNFMEITAKPANECGSIVSTANTALKEYLDPVLSRNTSVSDFCIDDVMNYDKPVSLYLVTPPSDLLRLAPIFRLFFEMMVKHHAAKMGFKDARPVDAYKHKCLFLMDEFSSLGNLQSFAATLSYIAGYGMKVFLIIQGVPQMNNIYGKDNQIFMNCHLQIIYSPNENDTANYAAQMLGKKTILVDPVDNGLLDKLFSKEKPKRSEMARDLMSADELKRLGDREIIVASGFPPVLTDKIKYYEQKFFTDKLVAAPVASDIIRPTTLPNHEYIERDALLGGAKPEEVVKGFVFKPDLRIDVKARREFRFRPNWGKAKKPETEGE